MHLTLVTLRRIKIHLTNEPHINRETPLIHIIRVKIFVQT